MKIIFLWLKALGLWLLVKENRNMGIAYTKKALVAMDLFSKMTKTNKDDAIAAYLAKKIDQIAKINGQSDEQVIQYAADAVTSISKGDLKDVVVKYEDSKIKVGFKNVIAGYNPKNGGLSLEYSKSL
jgi:hypothetical protein